METSVPFVPRILLQISIALLIFFGQAEMTSLEKYSAYPEHHQVRMMELLNFYQSFLIDYAFHREWSSARLILPANNYSFPLCEYFAASFLLSKSSLAIHCSSSGDELDFSSRPVPIIVLHFTEETLLHLLKSYSKQGPLLFLAGNVSIENLPSVTPSHNYKWTLAKLNVNKTSLELYNIYGISSSSLPLSQRIGSWGPDTGLELDRSEDFGPTNFQGHSLRFTTVGGPPFVNLDKRPNSVTATGYLPNILNLLRLILNFSVVMLTPSDGKFGDQDDSGNWSGMVGMLIRNEADVALMSFSYTRARRSVMGFSPPVEYSTTRLLIRRDQRPSGVKWGAFVRPFNLNVWTSILIIIGLGSLTLTIFAKLHLFQISSGELVWLLSTCFVNQGQTEHSTVRVTPFRIVSACFWLLAVFVFACYTARLTSFLAADSEKLPITDLAEAVTSSSWKIGVIKGSSFLEKVKESDTKEMQLLWRKIQQNPSVLATGYADGIERVHRESYIFFTSELIPTYLVKENCSYAWIPGKYFPGFGYMGYQKGLPYAPSISRTLQKIREVGLIRRTFKLWWGTQTGCTGGGDAFPAISLHEVGSAFVVLIAGAILAISLSSLEFLCRRRLRFQFQS